MSKKLYELSALEFQHPADKLALDVVKKTPGFNKLGEMLTEIENEYNERILCLGSCMQLTEKNSPRVWKVFNEACEIYNCKCLPDVFSYKSFSFKGELGGIKKPIIKLPDVIIRTLSDKQLTFMFGQLLTMIKLNSLPLHSIGAAITKNAGFIPLIGDALKVPVTHWYRKAQLTRDRGGLLCTQNYEEAMRYILLLSGVPQNLMRDISIDAAIENALEYATYGKKDAVELYGKFTNTITRETAWANERIIELFNWYESGQYQSVLDKHTEVDEV